MRLGFLAICFVLTPLYLAFAQPVYQQRDPETYAVIFDIGGVLAETKKITSARELGLRSIIWYYMSTGKSPRNIKQRFYNFLDAITQTKGNEYGARDDQNILMPQLMCDWLKNTRSAKEIRTLVLSYIKANPQWFENKSEQVLLGNLAKLIFTPKKFIKTQSLVSEAKKFVRECKKKGYKVYILSNFDAASFGILLKEHKKFFSLFDGIIISGDVHMMKPQPQIYTYFTDNLIPENCVFIDDRPENIKAAQQQGIHGILCKHKNGTFGSAPNFKLVKKEFAQWEKSRLIKTHATAISAGL